MGRRERVSERKRGRAQMKKKKPKGNRAQIGSDSRDVFVVQS